jgi:glycosyltransferase involved in cell wall biosynthesis
MLQVDGHRTAPLHIVTVCDHAHVSGGLAQVAHASARALSQRGHRVTFFAAVPPVDPALTAAGVEVVCLEQHDMLGDPSALRAAGRALWNPAAQRRLQELLRGLDPRSSVVHIHGWNKALSPSVLRAAERSGVPMVQTLHDYVAVCPNGALYDFVKQRNCPLRPMSVACIRANCDARNYGHKLWRVARQATLAASSGASSVRNIIYMLERQRQILAPHLPAGANLHWVSNPVGAEDHGPADVACHDAFVYVGRLSREKGVVLFAEAARRAGLHAVFVGEGPARSEIAAAAPDATITGWVENDVVVRYLRQARAVVFPSLWYETFGLAVYEALAAGVPPVVSDNAVTAGAIEHDVNGLIFANGDIDDLLAKLDSLRDPALATRLGRAAHARYWRDPLTIERHVSRLEEVYEDVINRKPQ